MPAKKRSSGSDPEAKLAEEYSPGSPAIFEFTDDMSRVFREGAPYRVYYCGSGPYQLIMSFEELGA